MNRMVASEKTATMLFDKAMKLNNVMVDGKLFNFEALSELTRTDLPRALELLSKFYMEGTLGIKEMQKMFTARHFQDISNILIAINGNVDNFTNTFAKGVDYTLDYYKNMFNINNQWKLLTNQITAVSSGTKDIFRKSSTGVLMGLNNIVQQLENFNKAHPMIKSMTDELLVFSSVATLTASSFGLISGNIKSVVTLLRGGLFTPLGAIMGIVTYGFLKASEKAYELNRNIGDSVLNITEFQSKTKQIGIEMQNIERTNAKIMLDIADANNSLGQSFNNTFNETTVILDGIMSKLPEFKQMYESLGNIKFIDESRLKDSNLLKMYEDTKQQFLNLQKDRANMLDKVAQSYADAYTTSKSIQAPNFNAYSVGGKGATVYTNVRTYNDVYRDATKVVGALDKIIASEEYRVKLSKQENVEGKKSSDIQSEIISKLSEKTNLTEKQVKDVLSRLDWTELQKGSKIATDVLNDLKNYGNQVKTTFKEVQDEIQKSIEGQNRLTAFVSQTELQLFEKTGAYSNKFGKEGYIQLITDSAYQNQKDKLDALDKQLQQIAKDKQSLQEFIDLGVDVEKNQKSLQELENSEKMVTIQKENQAKFMNEGFEEQMKLAKASLESIEYNEKNKNIIFEILMLYMEMAKLDPLAVNAHEKLQRGIDNLVKLAKENDKDIAKKHANNSTYQIKYNNYLKETLDIELEIAKLGKTKADQDLLSYQYKLKQLALDKEIAEKELEISKNAIAKLNAGGAYAQYKQRALQATSTREMQSVIDDFYTNHKGELKSDVGKAGKDLFDAIKQGTQAQAKYEKIVNELSLYPKKALNKFATDEMPKLVKDMYSQLASMGGYGLTGNINYDKSELEDLRSQYQDLIKQVLGETAVELSPKKLEKMLLDTKKKLDSLKTLAQEDPTDDKIEALKEVQAQYENQLELAKKLNALEEKSLKIYMKKVDAMSNIGNLMNALSDGLNAPALKEIGGMFTAMADMHKTMATQKFDFSKIFDPENFANALENATKGANFGSTVGKMMGSLFGGSVSTTAGGTLGGIVASMGGANAIANMLGMGGSTIATGGASIALSAGMSLLGGLFGGKDHSEEDARRTAEAKKIYDKNTDALNKLSQNMSNLIGSVDGLNNSLISYFSKLPTNTNLNRVTGAMTDMYKTLEKTRNFNKVAYQVQHVEKGKSGFLGIGGKAGRTWTETIELSVQDMLNRYGFKGSIEDMTTDQMRAFSKWLDDYDLGDSDNFSILADAIENYAESLDTFEKNIQSFFYDTTMESFAGISSLDQKQLRQQIEDFYKNMGFQIDEQVSKEIDKLAEEMSVMVTIMQDVRTDFVKSWRDTGLDAGKAFMSSMRPYVDAMLENISQVFYDVYFSDVTDVLNKEFKSLSDKLVELKKLGGKLEWDKVAGELSGSFENVLTAIKNAESQSESFNTILLQLQKQAMDSGLSLSDMLTLGLTSGTQKDILESFKSALTSNDSKGAMYTIGESIGGTIAEALTNKMVDNMLSDTILNLSAQMDKVLSGSMNFDALANLASEAMGVGLMLEGERTRLEAIKDMFSFGEINYENQESNIEYQTGTSQSLTQNFYVTSNLEVSNLVESDSIERLVNDIADELLLKLKDKGINL